MPRSLRLTLLVPSVLIVAALTSLAFADPILVVSDNGLVGSNREWLVEVSPDPSLFSGGNGALDIELAFEVTGSDLVGALVNATDWTFTNPGHNPFTGGVTLGLQIDPVGNTVFASFGSDLFTSGDLVQVLTIETLGSGSTTLDWGGHTLLPGTLNEFIGSRIAQADFNFDGYQGSLTLGAGALGDYDGSGLVGAGDLSLVLANWGQPGDPPPMGWVNDFPDGIISAGELSTVLQEWGNTTVVNVVPEPATFVLFLFGAVAITRRQRFASHVGRRTFSAS